MTYFSIFILDGEIREFEAAVESAHCADNVRKHALSSKHLSFPRNPMFRRPVESGGTVTYLDEETRNLLLGTPWETRVHRMSDDRLLAGCQLV